MTTLTAVLAPTFITKRDGRIVPFNVVRIEEALDRCFASLGREPSVPTFELASRVVNALSAKSQGVLPSVEGVQDLVEVILQASGEFEAAKAYILYRAEHQRQRAERPIPDEVRHAFGASDEYFPTVLQKFQFFDKYSRYDYQLGRRETWVETTDRAVDQLARLAHDRGPLDSAELARIRRGMLEMRVMPSMRLVAMAGPAYERDNATGFNCTYLPADGPIAVVEALLLSMAGCGVGFSVEREYVEQWPRVRRQASCKLSQYVVEDSAVGWGRALEFGLDCWLYGQDVAFDVSEVRPRGTPLRTKGGRASGPEPLVELLGAIRSRILARQGTFLRTTDVHDIMCMAGKAAVSGGVRRTAMISLFDRDDANMLQAKSGDFERDNSQRWNANNSAVWTDLGQLDQVAFVDQWLAMVKSGRGEPGIFSRAAAEALLPARRTPGYAWGSNPCFTGDTRIWTIYGPRRFDELVGREVPVLTQLDDGTMVFRPMTNIQLTRKQAPVYKVTLRNNYGTGAGQVRHRGKPRVGYFKATGDHVVFLRDGTEVQVSNLKQGDRLSSVYRGKANSKGYLTLDNGLDHEQEHKVVVSYVYGSRPSWPEFHVNHKDDVKWNNDPDNLEVMKAEDHNRLNMVGDLNPMRRFPESNHFRRDKKRRATNHEVVSVELVGRADVYDGTVEETHKFFIETEDDGGVLVHNCGEIVLRPWQMCNLSTVVARAEDTLDSLKAKVELAAVIGTVQSLGTYFPYLRDQWRKNCEEERLLGVSIGGQMDCPLLAGSQGAEVLSELRVAAVAANARVALDLGISPSAAVTCVKPDGNSSQLLDMSSGLHPRWAKYYVRNVRVSASSPLSKVLLEAGAPMSPENGDDPVNPRTWVVSFPVKAPKGARTRNDVSALEQCEFWLRNKVNWTEHNPSVTVTYKPEEVIDLMRWVWQNRARVGGMAFLPAYDANYNQLPYVECSGKEYEQRVAEFPAVDFSKVYRYEAEDTTTAAQEVACVAGTCDVQ